MRRTRVLRTRFVTRRHSACCRASPEEGEAEHANIVAACKQEVRNEKPGSSSSTNYQCALGLLHSIRPAPRSNGSRLSCGAPAKDSFLNLRATTASSAC